jgi:hypothetical protein
MKWRTTPRAIEVLGHIGSCRVGIRFRSNLKAATRQSTFVYAVCWSKNGPRSCHLAADRDHSDACTALAS